MKKLKSLAWRTYEILNAVIFQKYTISIHMIFKDCSEYLEEWIDFHILSGVEHFYLYNNNSNDEYENVLKKYIETGKVTLEQWPSSPAYPEARNHFCKKYGKESKWVAFLDDDEFLFTPIYKSLSRALKSYTRNSSVIAHWVMFGSNGHIKKPVGKVIENYLYSEGEINESYKIIAKPILIDYWENPHYCRFKNNELPVDENLKKLSKYNTIPTPRTANILRINHYASKSLEDGLKKLSRGWQCTKKVEDMRYWHKRDREFNKVEDNCIINYLIGKNVL